MATNHSLLRTLLASAVILLGMTTATAQSPVTAKAATRTMGSNPAMPVWDGPWGPHH